VADSYGVMIELPEIARPLFLRLGHDLPRINGSDTWQLPLSSTFVVAPDGGIAMAHADMALPHRLEPEIAIQVVRRLTGL